MSVINDNLHINGQLSCENFTPPASCVTDNSVSTTAAIDPDKLINRFRRGHAQVHGTAGTTQRIPIHIAKFAGTITGARAAMSVKPVGDSTHSIQLKKNGSNILSSAIVMDSGNTNYVLEETAGYTSTSYAAGDFFEADITATAGTGTLGQGLMFDVQFDEATT